MAKSDNDRTAGVGQMLPQQSPHVASGVSFRYARCAMLELLPHDHLGVLQPRDGKNPKCFSHGWCCHWLSAPGPATLSQMVNL